jgi:hypothetical protein
MQRLILYFVFGIITLLIGNKTAFAQSDSIFIKQAFGSTLHFSAHRWHTKKLLVENDSRFGIEGGLRYSIFLGEYLTLNAGMEVNERRSTFLIEDNETKVYESFIQLPVMVGWNFVKPTLNSGKSRYLQPNISAGVYMAGLWQQGFAGPTEREYNVQDRLLDYYKYGFVTEISLMLMPANPDIRTVHVFGLRGARDFKDAVSKSNDNIKTFSNYATGSVFYAILFRK